MLTLNDSILFARPISGTRRIMIGNIISSHVVQKWRAGKLLGFVRDETEFIYERRRDLFLGGC